LKKLNLMIGMLLFSGALVSCTQVVENSALESVPTETVEIEPVQPVEMESEEKPTKITETVIVVEDQYEICLDADVQKPQTDGWSVVTVHPTPFSQELVDRVVQYFFGNATFFTSPEKTKQEISDEIAETREDMESMDVGSDDWNGAENALKDLEAAYKNAPETVTKTTVRPVFLPQEDADAEENSVYADLGCRQASWLNVLNLAYASNWNILTVQLDRDNLFLPGLPQPMDTNAFTPEAAQAFAEDALQAMAIRGFTLVSVAEGYAETSGEYGYILDYRRSIDGLPVSMGVIPGYSTDPSRWNSDRITFRVGENGITALEWDEYSVLGTLSETVEILPLETVLPTARQALIDGYSQDTHPYSDSSRTVFVDRIVLEYHCISDKETAQPLIVPTWAFYGDIRRENADGTVWFENEGRQDLCLVALNALDGSLVCAEEETVTADQEYPRGS